MKKAAFLISFLSFFHCAIFAENAVDSLGALPIDGTVSKDSNTLCLDVFSGSVTFYDFEHYILITNYISTRQYVYWKKQKKLTTVIVDSNLVRGIYLDFLKDSTEYKEYRDIADKGQFKPKVVYSCPYDDSTVLGYLITYKTDSVKEGDEVIMERRQLPSVLEISPNSPLKIVYVNKVLPIESHYLAQEIFSYKKELYVKLSPDEEELLPRKEAIKMLARFKKRKSVFSVDRIEPESMPDYLVTNKVFENYNRYYQDNGYVLMSLSNYVIHLQTGEKITLPIEDKVFRSLQINPKNYSIGYYAIDFKYNALEKRFYMLYSLGDSIYAASFKAGDKSFEQNIYQCSSANSFGTATKNICLSWDGKRVLYAMKDESCVHYAPFSAMQELEEQYEGRAK